MQLGLVIYGSLESRSGGYLYDRQLLRELERVGDSVELISIPQRSYAQHLMDNVSRDLLRRCLHGEFDLLLQDELNHPSLFLLNKRLRKKSNLPIVSIVHHLRIQEKWPLTQKLLYQRVERSYLHSLDGVINNSHATRKSVEALTELPAIVMHPGRDHIRPEISREDISARATQTGPLRLLFLGNLIPRKGLHTLLRALGEIPQEIWRLNIVGNIKVHPSYTRRIQRLIASLGMEKNVQMIGSLPEPEVAEHLSNAHLLTLPAQYEGFGIVYLEAMGFGVPPIATSAGGASELVHHGENGFLIEPGDVNGLVEIVQRISTDRGLLRDLSLSAQKTYQSHPTWKEGVKKVRLFLKFVLSKSSQMSLG
jgi:glycosyltransferase involved in cell wall biosynthesis